MRHNLCRHLIQAAFTIVGAATLGLVAVGGQSTFAASPNAIDPEISFTGTVNGVPNTVIVSSNDNKISKPDISRRVNHAINIDKTTDIKENMTISNTTNITHQIYSYLQLPGFDDDSYSVSL